MFEAYAQTAIDSGILSDDCKGFYQWSSMAFTELYLLEPGETRWLKRTLAMADWILDVHRVLGRRRNTGYAFEGLVSAYHLAHLDGSMATMVKLRTAIETGLSRLSTWQVGSSVQSAELQALSPRNPSALGGVLGAPQESLLRIDTTQHQMHALLLAERYLDLGPG
jgi:UDP-N-acetylmuramoyl-tripeptide--D-alanyl-D-alanine ligase